MQTVVKSISNDYRNEWEDIIRQPAMRALSFESKTLVDNLARIGNEHATQQSKYQKEILAYLWRWTVEARQKPTENAGLFVYNAVVKHSSAVQATKECEQLYMKRLIPGTYALFGAIFLALSVLFGFTFYLGWNGGTYLIGPWTNLMLLVAAVGLTATVLVACLEWRKWQDGEEGEKTAAERYGKRQFKQ